MSERRVGGASPRSPSGSCGRTGSRASATAIRFAYTQPSPGRYPWQWYWDSCFAAIVWRRFEPARARAELESLLAAQRPDGFIGHTIFWARPVSWLRLPFYNVASRRALPDRDDPAAAAGLGLADRRRRPGRGAADRRARSTGWPPTATSRATACSGSSSPTSPGSTPRPSSNRSGGGGRTARIGFPLLVHRNRRLGFDARRIRERGGPVLCETARQHALVALAAGAGAALGDAGAGRAALGRAARPLPRRGAAGRRAARRR